MTLFTTMGTFDYYAWVILPILIFLSRICDVTLGTLRHVFISKGYKSIVPILGFFEVLLWIIVVAEVMKNLNNWMCYIGWASGFATGTYVGLLIEERLALGLQVIRIITHQSCDQLVSDLKKKNHGVTIIEAQGAVGPVKVILSIVSRANVNAVVNIINRNNPNAFYSIEDVRDKGQGVFTNHKNSSVFKRIFSVRK